jgi:hypothetical protein
MTSVVNENPKRKQRRISDRKIWEMREKFLNGVSKARIAVEEAHELDVDLGAPRVGQSGNPRGLSAMSAKCLAILMEEVLADEARYG